MSTLLKFLTLAGSIFAKTCISGEVFDEQFEVYKYNYTRRFDYKYTPITSINDPINEPTNTIITKDIKYFSNIIAPSIMSNITGGEVDLQEVHHWNSLLSKLVNEPYTVRYEPVAVTVFANRKCKRSELLNKCSILFQVPTNRITICYI